jgi:hypothetical protein
MEHDISKIAIYGMYMVAGEVFLIFARKVLEKKYAVYLFIAGSIFFSGSIILNSYIEQNWSREFIVDYLLIKEVGIVGLRKTILIAYICYLWAITILALTLIKQKRKNLSTQDD